ncbi:hypothetical protein SAY86_019722 [Trapa natans]|uniref:mitogen-activated protein kinase kinase kinase n=1 Tax=Trapa natans TaxID=22666 RepID=A0AAN7R723_TRANT|nr:hypothetical protein SAY86_019722 [Trapa natans]
MALNKAHGSNTSISTHGSRKSGSHSRSGSSIGLNGPALLLDLKAARSNKTFRDYSSSVEGFGSPNHASEVQDGAGGSETLPESVKKSISPYGRFKRTIEYWQKGERLGRGSFGTVYEGIANDGFFLAIKEVSLLDEGSRGRNSISHLEREIAMLSKLEHENIVRYIGTDKDESNLYIFLERIAMGSLEKIYQKYPLHDSQVSAYTRQILHGLKYLHNMDVIHRDIKCANILVDANGSAKLADFGLAKTIKDVNSCQGTAYWMAPEVVSSSKAGYGLSADIWSLGCTVLEMLTDPSTFQDRKWEAAQNSSYTVKGCQRFHHAMPEGKSQ